MRRAIGITLATVVVGTVAVSASAAFPDATVQPGAHSYAAQPFSNQSCLTPTYGAVKDTCSGTLSVDFPLVTQCSAVGSNNTDYNTYVYVYAPSSSSNVGCLVEGIEDENFGSGVTYYASGRVYPSSFPGYAQQLNLSEIYVPNLGHVLGNCQMQQNGYVLSWYNAAVGC
jgi:hypothetical protein